MSRESEQCIGNTASGWMRTGRAAVESNPPKLRLNAESRNKIVETGRIGSIREVDRFEGVVKVDKLRYGGLAGGKGAPEGDIDELA